MPAQLYYLYTGIKKIKEVVNQPRYGIVYNCKYYQIIGFRNNWIITNFIGDGTYEEDYKHINLTVIDVNLMNTSLISMEGKYGAIDADNSSCHGYYIIKMSSYPYTLQTNLRIYCQVISSG